MAISRLSTPCVKLASFLIFSPASGETRVRAQAVENAFFSTACCYNNFKKGSS